MRWVLCTFGNIYSEYPEFCFSSFDMCVKVNMVGHGLITDMQRMYELARK